MNNMGIRYGRTNLSPVCTFRGPAAQQWHEWDVVPCEKFIGIRPASPEDGIMGYWLSPPPWCDSEPFHLPGWWIAKNLPKPSEDGRAVDLMSGPIRTSTSRHLSFAQTSNAPEAKPPRRGG